MPSAYPTAETVQTAGAKRALLQAAVLFEAQAVEAESVRDALRSFGGTKLLN